MATLRAIFVGLGVAVLVVVGGGVGSAPSQRAVPSNMSDEACEVTLLALEALVPDPGQWVLRDGPYIGEGWLTEEFVLQRLTPEESEFNLGWIFLAEADGLPLHTTGPSADMARAFAHAAPSPGLSCPDVRDLWERELALRRDAGPVELPDHDGEPPSASVGLRRAVVSPDGREAIVYADLIYGPESGYGFLILFRRNMSGHWWEAARLGVWIS